MEKRPSPILLLIVIMACFAAGILSVWLRHPPQPSSTTETASSTRASSQALEQSEQTSILILGVDDLLAPNPALRAVWYVSYRLPGRDIFVLGLPIDCPVSSPTDAELRTLFAWSPQSGIARSFLEGLSSQLPPSPDVTLVLDEQAFAGLVDFLGGVTLEGAHLDGSQVVSVLALLSDQPDAFLNMQQKIINALVAEAPALGTSPDLTTLIQYVPQHAYSSLAPLSVVALVSPLFPISATSVHIALLGQ
jgi:hypothetical protein